MRTEAKIKGPQAALQAAETLTNSGSRHRIVETEYSTQPCVIRTPIKHAPPADFWREISIQSLAADHELAPRVLDVETLTQTTVLERAIPARLNTHKVSQTLRALHALPKVAPRLDIKHAFEFWFSQLEPNHAPWNQASNRDRAGRARVLFDQHQPDQVLCHGDPVPDNFMSLVGRCVLIDWEYACLAPFWWDLAIYGSESGYAEAEKTAFLEHYLSAPASASQIQTLAKFISIYQDLRELWSLATAARAISYPSDAA